MNKTQLIGAMADKAGVSGVIAAKCYEAFAETVIEALAAGDKVALGLSGFGNFEVKERAARAGVNPKTGEKIAIAASKNVAFKAGKSMKERL